MRGRALAAALLTVLAACASNPRPEPPPPAVPPAPVLDASYDWHVLLLAPFGSVVKEVPFKLHEVLLFKDQQAQEGDGAECYASDAEPPLFLKQTPSQYLLCFRRDHLSRIEAQVILPRAEAGAVLGEACALWHRNAGEGVPEAQKPCAGSDGTVRYEAHVDEEAAEGAEVPLNLQLEQVAPPES